MAERPVINTRDNALLLAELVRELPGNDPHKQEAARWLAGQAAYEPDPAVALDDATLEARRDENSPVSVYEFRGVYLSNVLIDKIDARQEDGFFFGVRDIEPNLWGVWPIDERTAAELREQPVGT